MSVTDTNDTGETQDPMEDEKNPLRSVVRDLEKKMKKLEQERDEAAGKLSTYERSEVFEKAGIPNEGPAAFFRSSYQGDLTEEAVRKAALEHGFIKESTDPNVDAGLNAGDKITETTGSPTPPGPDIGQRIADATSIEELNAIMNDADLVPPSQ